MKRIAPILLAITALIFASLACQAFSAEMSLENLRMAHDQDGNETTSTFASTDIFYAVADLKNAPNGTVVKSKWIAAEVSGYEPDLEIQEQSVDITEDQFSGTIYFQLSNADGWPAGTYRVDIYLNDTLSQSVEFSVE